jgi:hypothetical protein
MKFSGSSRIGTKQTRDFSVYIFDPGFSSPEFLRSIPETGWVFPVIQSTPNPVFLVGKRFRSRPACFSALSHFS